MKRVGKDRIGGSYNNIGNSLFTGFKTLRNKMGFGMVILVLLLFVMPISLHIKAEPDENETSEIYYQGKVTGRVNVRTGAGTDYEQLRANGKSVTLEPGTQVIIIGEAMVGTKPWYQVRFEINGETYEGYSTSSYIEKLSETITPTPLPTPSPTPTPIPTPTLSPTPTPVVADITDTPNQDDGKNDLSKGLVTALIIIFVLAAIGILGFIILKSLNTKEKKEMTKAVKGLKNVKLSEKQSFQKSGSKSKTKQVANRKTPVIKPAKKDIIEEELLEESYSPEDYIKDNERIFDNLLPENNTEERIKEVAFKETDEKKILRKEIDSLRQHDIVEHKYFGKGEVYDNSDVKLIEVRFGNDVRFLNKDSLIAKKLLKKSREVNARWHV